MLIRNRKGWAYPWSVVVVLGVLCTNIHFGASTSPTDSLGRINLFTKLPFGLLLFYTSESYAATSVWIPEAETPKDTDGSVLDEYAEVAHVFAKPDSKVIKAEQVASEQAVPWTTLKQEYELYQKYHKIPKASDDSDEEEEDDEDDAGPEDSDADAGPAAEEGEDDDEEGDEEDDQDDTKISKKKSSSLPDELPIAFYGQENSDDDENDFALKEIEVRKRSKKVVKPVKSVEESEEDDQGDDSSYDDIPESIRDDVIAEMQQSESGVYKKPPGAEEDSEEFDVSSPKRKVKGEESEEEEDIEDLPQDDEGGKGKGKKKKKGKKGKKGKKKGGQGWGWKPKVTVMHIPPPEEKGWGWQKKDGLLEQMVKGSTWERVLDYYHYQKEKQGHKGEGHGWGWKGEDSGTKIHKAKEGLVKKLFKGSFWDRAFQTYSQFKNDQSGHPNKELTDTPLKIDW